MNPKTGEESDPKYEAEPDDPTETTDEVPIVRPRDRGEHGARRAGGAVRVDRDASSPLGDAGTAPVAPQDDPAGDDVTAAPPTDTTSGDAPTASARRDTGPTAAPQTDTATVEPEPGADTAAGGSADVEPAAVEPEREADPAAGGSADVEPAAVEPERE
ncbi:MAG TPA: hypothetical protein VK875_04760, partial [Euzebyales bacterium]|nr:hypothetical protein [Euzebyales bacterium]